MRLAIGGAVSRPGWPGGEALVVRQLVDGFRDRGDFVSTFAQPRTGASLTATAATPVDADPVNVGQYRRSLSEFDPEVVLAFFDYDASLIRAARGLGLPVISCVQIHWPVCPMATLYLEGQGICSGPEGRKCIRHLARSSPPLHLEPKHSKISLPAATMIYTKFRTRHSLVSGANAYVVPSQRSAEILRGRRYEPIHIIPNSVRVSEFTSTAWSGGPRVVLFPSGSISERKGFYEFQRVARMLRGRVPGVVPTANNYGGDEWVEGLPRLDRRTMVRTFEGAFVVVLPVLWDEPFGIVAIEAMAAGRPVVAYARGALPEIVVDGVTGTLVPPGDTRGLARAIESLVEDPDLANEMGAAGRQRVERMYDVTDMVEAYRALAHSMVH